MVANRCLKLSCEGSTYCDGARRRTTTTSFLRLVLSCLIYGDRISGVWIGDVERSADCGDRSGERSALRGEFSFTVGSTAQEGGGFTAGGCWEASGSGSLEYCEKISR